jgi:Rieske [2Fe-2S] domain
LKPIPKELEEIAAFAREHQPPAQVEAGKMYQVPCLTSPRFRRRSLNWTGTVPLLGTVHEDSDLVGFKPWHVHVDWRFVKPTKDKRFVNGESHDGNQYNLANVLTLSYEPLVYSSQDQDFTFWNDVTCEIKLKLCRFTTPYPWITPDDVPFRAKLQQHFQHCDATGGLCPHRGLPLSYARNMGNGRLQCPLHGLEFTTGQGPVPSGAVGAVPGCVSAGRDSGRAAKPAFPQAGSAPHIEAAPGGGSDRPGGAAPTASPLTWAGPRIEFPFGAVPG